MTWDDQKDITANHHGDDPLSVEAHDSIRIHKGQIRRTILTYIYLCEEHGATCEEVERALGINHQSASARIAELRALGQIQTVDNERRRTRSGRWARVHRVPDGLVKEDVAEAS